MAYKSYFMDDTTYSAQDINNVLAQISSSGISLSSNVLAGLNGAISDISDNGIINTNSCKLIKDGDLYTISQGSAIMGDGSVIIFDSSGYTFDMEHDVKHYIYLERKTATNSIDIVVSASPPTSTADTVPIAEVSSNKEIVDKRKFASAKVTIPSANQYITIQSRGSSGFYNGELYEVGKPFRYVRFYNSHSYRNECLDIEAGDKVLIGRYTNFQVEANGTQARIVIDGDSYSHAMITKLMFM